MFRVSIYGESHGPEIGVILDGVMPGLPLAEEDFLADILRRKSGARGTTPRLETDLPMIRSGVLDGHTTGAPLMIAFANASTRPADYEAFRVVPRPGHADRSADLKFGGQNDLRGGGHFSGRLTLPVLAAGVVARKMLSALYPASDWAFEASLAEVGGVSRETALARAASADLPDHELWRPELEAAAQEGDSLGGIVSCRVSGVPAGLGAPYFDSVESIVSHLLFAIPGVRGVEFGDGFAASRMKGSAHNDPWGPGGVPLKNGAGGVNGGISNGAPLTLRVAFKPTSSIRKPQQTWDFSRQEMTQLQVEGRHDVCFALRTPVIVETFVAVALADLALVR